MTRLALAMALLAIVNGCDGDPHVHFAQDGSKKLTELSSEDLVAMCETSLRAIIEPGYPAWCAVYGISMEEKKNENCEAKRKECLAENNIVDVQKECARLAAPLPDTSCVATVSDYEACVNATINQWIDISIRYRCSKDPDTLPGLNTELVTQCQAVTRHCHFIKLGWLDIDQ